MEELLRPYGVVVDGALELGLEVVREDGVVREVRPHTGVPDAYVLSPAFANSHSHLEYRGLLGALSETEYWPWIRAITLAKRVQRDEDVRSDCLRAARENLETGVAAIAEHSDRPYAGEALSAAGLRAAIFQEVITRFEPGGPKRRLEAARENLSRQLGGFPAYLSPHAYQTVDDDTLRRFGNSGQPLSIHVAETDLENQLSLDGSGAIAETLRERGIEVRSTGRRLIATLEGLGLVRTGAQFVHCCAIDDDEIRLLGERGVSVAHCPRSNARLGCPPAPVREMIDEGVQVGLGLDSPASSGPIDMFAEMRAAMQVAIERRRPLSAEEVWRMATSDGAGSLRFVLPDLPSWEIAPGSSAPLIRLTVEGAYDTADLIERGSPSATEFQDQPARRFSNVSREP